MSYVRNLFTAIGDYLWDHGDIDLDKFTEDYKKLCKSSIDPYLKKHRTIMDDEGHTFLTESITKFLLDQDITLSLSKVYKLEDLARRKTETQTFQAMEAMVHNLNTMQCFPGYERLWVFDKFSDQWCLFSFKELHQRFKQGRYYALSFNVETKQTEVQLIEDCVVRPNEKDIYTTRDSTGGVYTTTLDHRFLTGTCNTDTSGSMDITGYEPAMLLQQSVLPLSFKIPELKETKGMLFNSEEVSISMLNQQELTKYQNKNLHCEDILFSFNSDLAAFLGYYIAVGIPQIDSSSFDGPTIRFGISTHNDCDFTHHVEVLKTLIKNLGIVDDDSAFFVNVDIGDLFVTFNKPLIFFVLDRICGKGMSNYHIPNFILSGTKELQNVFLEAMKLRVSNDGIFHSYSADLIADLRLLFLSRGVVARKVVTDIASDYSLEWPNLKSLDTDNSTFTLSVIDKTSPAPEEDEVYDISVAKNQNFVLADGAIVHNSRAGSQTPFSSVNFGTDTSWEGRLVSKCTMQAFDKGLGKGETAIFPIAIFRMKKGITDKGSPNYDLFKMSCEISAKRLFPNWVNVDAPYNLKYYKPEDPRTQIAAMGCRTRVISNVYDPKHEICYGRGNLFWTTLNLPYIALEVKESLEKVTYPDGYSKQWLIDAFFKRLDQEIDDILDFSRDRLRIISKRKAFNYPFAMGQHEYVDSEKLNLNDSIEEVIKQGTISVGFIGLAETLITLIGKHHGESEEAQELGLKIVSFMRARMDQESKNTNMNYSLMATPAEGCTGRLCKLIAKRFGIIPGITDKKYLVNSSHVPPKFHISVADKIRIEAPYHELENAGHIFYCEQDADISKNPEALEDIVTMAADAGCGYIAVNHPVTRDPVCGYVGPLNPDDTCPRCGRKEYEGVTARTLLNLTAYSPDPEYAVTSEKLEDEDKTINDL